MKYPQFFHNPARSGVVGVRLCIENPMGDRVDHIERNWVVRVTNYTDESRRDNEYQPLMRAGAGCDIKDIPTEARIELKKALEKHFKKAQNMDVYLMMLKSVETIKESLEKET